MGAGGLFSRMLGVDRQEEQSVGFCDGCSQHCLCSPVRGGSYRACIQNPSLPHAEDMGHNCRAKQRLEPSYLEEDLVCFWPLFVFQRQKSLVLIGHQAPEGSG